VSAVPVALAAKSPEAFRTISEAAIELDVPQHVLRFWETRFAQIRPVKRAGGRRYYRPEDVELLRGIRALLYTDGYTIKGVQKILREQGVRHVAETGRQAPRTRARRDPPAETPDEPRYARAAIARVQEAHADLLSTAGSTFEGELDKAARAKLEALLKELALLKGQLRFARERMQAP
jgi:DNA-binding transcriptional MerR regulator